MAVSSIDVINAAIRLVDGNRIASLTDGSANANIANDLYSLIRDELLVASTWRFATRLSTLAQSSDDPIFGYDNAFFLPSDWLRTVSVHDNDRGVGALDFEEADVDGIGVLFTSVDTVYLKYIYQLTNLNRASAGFRKALITALARDFSVPIANSNTMYENYRKKAISDLNRAKATDSLGSPSRQRPQGSWTASRFRTGSVFDDSVT